MRRLTLGNSWIDHWSSPYRAERRRYVLLAEPFRLDKARGPALRLRVGDCAMLAGLGGMTRF